MSHAGVDPNALGQWLQDGKLAIDLFRASIGLLPKGPDREKVEAQVAQAEEALKRSEAAVAKDLGFSLCRCTFPPPIMLWDEKRGADVCPRPECGHAIQRRAKPIPPRSGGPHSWMAG